MPLQESFASVLLNYVKKYLDEGRQGYIVCPMIEESDMDLQDVKTYAKKLSQGTFKDYNCGTSSWQ